MRNLKTYIIIGLVLIASALYAKAEWDKSRLRKSMRVEMEAMNELRQEKRTIYSRYAIESQKLDEALKGNDSLKTMLKSRDEELRGAASATLRYKNLYLEAQGEVRIDTIPGQVPQCEVKFAIQKGRIGIEGLTRCPSGQVSLAIVQEPLSLQFYITKTKSGFIRSYLETNDTSLVVEDLKVLYKEEKPGFLRRHAWKIGIGAGIITYALLKE